MKTEWLEWLVFLKKYGSLQKVGDVCHVTPQNIGKMLNHLEEEIGIEIFDRKSKKLKLNQSGEELAELSEELIRKIDLFIEQHRENKSEIHGTLELISSNSVIFQDIIDIFLKKAPNVAVSYAEMSYEEALEYVKNHVQALAFISIWQNEIFNQKIEGYEQYCIITTLYKDEQTAFVSQKSSLAKAKALSLKDISKKQILVYSRSGDPNKTVQVFNSLGLGDEVKKLKIVGTNSLKYFAYMIKNDFSIGFGVKSNFSFKEDDGICEKKLSDIELYACNWCLVYNIKKKMSEADKKFIALLESYCSELKNNRG